MELDQKFFAGDGAQIPRLAEHRRHQHRDHGRRLIRGARGPAAFFARSLRQRLRAPDLAVKAKTEAMNGLDAILRASFLESPPTATPKGLGLGRRCLGGMCLSVATILMRSICRRSHTRRVLAAVNLAATFSDAMAGYPMEPLQNYAPVKLVRWPTSVLSRQDQPPEGASR
jgi:hypothetical protein